MNVEEFLHPFVIVYFCVFVLLVYKFLIFPWKLLVYNTIANHEDDLQINLGVSVIIAAKNEESNLSNNLPFILEQDYKNFEVIVINDQSWDDTVMVLEELKEKYSNLKTINIDPDVEEFRGKKLALTLGIKDAKNDILLFTDADCKPISNQWIKNMAIGYSTNDIKVVLGYSHYLRKNSLLNVFSSYETLQTGISYLSSALNGYPFMGVGRNLSYRKSLFFEQKGFSPFLKVPFGDDDLFINKVANSKNTSVIINNDSFVESVPKTTLSSYLSQKQRHQAASKFYNSISKIRQLFSFSILFGFYTIPLLIFIYPLVMIPFGILFVLGNLLMIVSQTILSKKLYYNNLGMLSVLLQPIYIFIYQPLIGVAGIIRNNNKGW